MTVDDVERDQRGQRPPARRRRRRVVLAVLGVTALAVAGWTVVTGLIAAHRLQAVRTDLSQLVHQNSLDRDTLERALVRDIQTARSAEALLAQPGPRLASWVPVLGRNVDAERAVSRASVVALQAGLDLARSTDDLANGSGGVDIGRLRTAAAALGEAAARLHGPLQDLARQSVGWTLPQTGNGVRAARNQLLGLDDEFRRAAAGLSAVSDVLGGDGRRTVLVGLTNNAELRGSGGLLSAYALGTAEGGQLTLRPFRDVNLVAQRPADAQRVPAPPDYSATFGPYLANTTLWKNVAMSPRGDEVGSVLAGIAKASLGVRPDVVVLCDVPAAASVISATGPVLIQGESVTGDELTRRLLVDAYGNGSLSRHQQQRRRGALTSAATQAFDRLRRDAAATPALLRSLADAVNGRHLVLWSANPAEEEQLREAGAAGAVDPAGGDIAMAVTNNLGDSHNEGNKLDYYVDRTMRVDVQLRPTSAEVVQTLTLRNTAPVGLGPYVEGVAHPGEIAELLSFETAADAELTSFTRDANDANVSIDRVDGAQRLTTLLVLPRGGSVTYRLSYRVPVEDGRYRLLLVPQALARPAQLTVRVAAVDSALGVTTGIPQPTDGVVTVRGAWASVRQVVVPVHPYRGLRAISHAIAHFWTHKVSL